MPEPIAFVVMPFDTKPTGRSEQGVPTEVDFDALWHRVYHPVLEKMDYTPVRADRDVGALIIAEMIQRLALADLVVADVTLPNANVYYEIGVRHAAREVGCVLVLADWAKPVFDLAQIRQLRFPLPEGTVDDRTARQAAEVLAQGLGPLSEGSSPVFAAVPGWPDSDPARATAFKEQVAELSAFDADIRSVRVAPSAERRAKALEVFERHAHKRALQEAVVLELLRLLRDAVGWQEMLDYIESLPPRVARHPLVLEQRALALGKSGDSAAAAGQLQTLIEAHGPTPERLGLLGGRYKELYRAATTDADRRRYLNGAIKAYEEGMLLDLNAYYAASNLSSLYLRRGDPGDDEKALATQLATVRACERATTLGLSDEWTRLTLLGCAFERRDVEDARRLAREVEDEPPSSWALKTTLDDIEGDLELQPDDEVRTALAEILEVLRAGAASAPVPT